MHTSLDCIPCIFRQTLEAARQVTGDTSVHERVMKEAAGLLSEMATGTPPPLMAGMIHRRLREITGIADPYREVRQAQNATALSFLPRLKKLVAAAEDPFEMAVRLAIAGNVIDLGVCGSVSAQDIDDAIDRAVAEPVEGDMGEFKAAVRAARFILYLTDNAGEIVFDRLLIETIGPDRVTVAVRGAPVINDAVHSDAVIAGLTGITKVVDNGSDAPGTVLADCSAEFRRLFADADLIISKGQGNFETLGDTPGPIAFLFKVKCPAVERLTGIKTGKHVLIMKGNQ